MPLLVILVGSLKLKVSCLLLAERTYCNCFFHFSSLSLCDGLKVPGDYSNLSNGDSGPRDTRLTKVMKAVAVIQVDLEKVTVL